MNFRGKESHWLVKIKENGTQKNTKNVGLTPV